MTILFPSLRDDSVLKLAASLVSWSLVAITGYQFVGLAWRYILWRRRTSPLFGLPGPTHAGTSFLLGQFMVTAYESFLKPHEDWWRAAREEKAKRDGDDNVPLLHYTSALGRSYVAILEPSLVQKVLIAPMGIEKPPIIRDLNLVRPILGDSVATLEGVEWRRHRHIVQPAFAAGVIQEVLPSSILSRVKTFISYWKKSAGREIDVSSHFSALTLDILGDVAFSHSFGGLDSVREWSVQNNESREGKVAEVQDPLIQALKATFKIDAIILLLFFTGLFGLNKYVNPKTIRTRRKLNNAVDKIVEKARQDFDISSNKSTVLPKKSILHLLLQSRYGVEPGAGADTQNDSKYAPPPSRVLTDVELRDEIKAFIIAGHETTSSWLHWAVYALIKFPDVQERVYQDVIKHAGTSDDISLEIIEKMGYYNAFLMEVLRLYPPGNFVIRSTRYDDKFGNFEMPAGTNIVIFPFLLHRHPTYWDDPLTFRPERWIECTTKPESNDGTERDESTFPYKHRFAFIPFSAGSRNCVGQRFATMEAKMIMAPLIRDFVFTLAPSQRETLFAFDTFITMTTKPPLKVCLIPRPR